MALGTWPLRCLGVACSWDMRFKMLGTGLLLGQVLQIVWDGLALGRGPSKPFGRAPAWDWPLKMLGTGPLLGFDFAFASGLELSRRGADAGMLYCFRRSFLLIR